jgi:LysM repeat protein
MKPSGATSPMSAPVAVTPEPELIAVPADAEETDGSQAAPQTPPAVDSVPAPLSPPDAYRALIAEDEEGITIVLEVPDDSPALYAPQPEPIAQVGPNPLETTGPLETAGEDMPAREANDTLPASEMPSPESAPAQAPREVLHVVVAGDTLWHIAERYVRDPFRYPELARLSNIANPDLIYPGNRVRIIIRTRSRPEVEG